MTVHPLRGKGRLTAALLAITILLIASGCSGSAGVPELIEPQNAQRPTCTAVRKTIYDVEVLDGEVVPEITQVRADKATLALSCKVIPGQKVKAGDILLEYDLQDAEERLEDLKADYDFLKLKLETEESKEAGDIDVARIELDKMRWQGAGYMSILRKEQEIERLELENTQHAEERAFELKKAEAELADLEETVNNNVMKSPVNGIVVYTANLQYGTQIQQKDLLFIIASEKKFQIRSEYKSSRVIESCSKIEARIAADTYPIAAQPYDQIEYSRRIISGSSVYTYYKIRGAKTDNVKMGDYAAVFLYTNYREDVLALPSTAVYRDSDGYYVYLADGDHNVRQTVSVGAVTELYYEITDGLEEGAQVYVKE